MGVARVGHYLATETTTKCLRFNIQPLIPWKNFCRECKVFSLRNSFLVICFDIGNNVNQWNKKNIPKETKTLPYWLPISQTECERCNWIWIYEDYTEESWEEILTSKICIFLLSISTQVETTCILHAGWNYPQSRASREWYENFA